MNIRKAVSPENVQLKPYAYKRHENILFYKIYC